jgi:hypothetical protein
LGLIEFWSAEVASYQPLDLGSVHPNTREFPGYRLAKQANLPNDQRFVIRTWVVDEPSPEFWNWSEKFSGEANAFQIFIREFREPRKTYAPKTKGLPLTAVYKLALTAAGAGYTPGTLPALTFDNTGTSGTGAAGHAVVNPDGTIAELVLDNGGDAYASAPTFTITAPPSGGTTATGTAIIQPATALLVSEEAQQFPDDSEFKGLYLNVVRVYETLPGPYIPFTHYDQNLGPIQGRRRAVLNTGQVTTLGATSKKTYEGRDGSSIVSWEIEENWSDGTGSAGNPAYPIQTSTDFEKDGIKKVTTRQLTPVGDIVTSETLSGDTLTREYEEAYADNPALAFQVIETITVDDVDLLDLPSFTTSIPNLIPEIFRAQIPTHVESHIIEGTATETALSTGEFEHSERQLTPLYKEVRSTVLDDIGALPITITGQKETNQNKQVVTVSMKLCVDSTTPTVPTALIDVDFKKLGNGLAIEITKTIPSVFAATAATVEIPDLIPPEFRAAFPLTTTEASSAGTAANPPSLSTGDIRKTEAQIDAFVKRVTTASRGTISFPATLTLHETTTEFGGGDLKILVTINNSPLTIDEGLLVVSSEAKPLGGGLYLRVTKSLNDTAWPIIASDLFDEEMRVQYPREEQVVDAGTAADTSTDGVVEEVKGLDLWRSIRIRTSKTPDATDEASAIISYEMRPFTYPARLDIDTFFASLGTVKWGFQAPIADLVRVTTRTWWETASSAPDIAVDEIIPSYIVLPNVAGTSVRFDECLHDEYTVTAGAMSGFVFAATTPDYTTFIADWVGTERIIGATVMPDKQRNLWRVTTRSIIMK